jgi:competence protein ComEA
VLWWHAGRPSLECVGDLPRHQVLLCGLGIVAVALAGARYLKQEEGQGGGSTAAARPPVKIAPAGSGQVFVHVAGAVRRPGVYRLPGWARLDVAVRRAGGPARGADLEGVNLAAKLADGQQVVVPRKGPGGAGAMVAGAVGEGGTAQGPISLNTATPEQLDQLDGVGPVTAQKILEWRKQHGGFSSVDDLKQIGGIGPKRFESLKAKVGM